MKIGCPTCGYLCDVTWDFCPRCERTFSGDLMHRLADKEVEDADRELGDRTT